MIGPIPLSELANLTQDVDVFITCASFESRCLSIARHIGSIGRARCLIVVNEDFEEYVQGNAVSLSQILGGSCTIVSTSTANPFQTADNLLAAVKEVVASTDSKHFLIDISTFTHEGLLILIQLLPLILPSDIKITVCYTNAGDYDPEINSDAGDDESEDKTEAGWLSKGVGEVRSILGYPGDISPIKLNHLIILVGMEYDRALALIDAFEPSRISLGRELESDSSSPKHLATNHKFAEVLKRAMALHPDVREFKFPCFDPLETCNVVLNQASDSDLHNHIVAPMNTKLSTLGAALAAKRNPSLQLCYASVLLYNTTSYSIPSGECFVEDFNTLFPSP